MIIDNNFNNKNKFQDKMKSIKNNAEMLKSSSSNPFIGDVSDYNDINDKSSMKSKSIAMLQKRLDAGVITMDDFTREMKKINKNYK